ncbi:MAG: cbb3-type cytochrome oxidase assembly protein CcoS [Candidatus Wenzhouxiangella sp. M2_3B_020]
MKIIYILIPLSLMLLSLAVWAFFWAVRNDQFDDLDTPAMDILDDDDKVDEGQDSGDGDRRQR